MVSRQRVMHRTRTRTDCPDCYAETYREFSDEMISLKISLQKVRVDMTKLRQDLTSEIANLESDIDILTSQISSKCDYVNVNGILFLIYSLLLIRFICMFYANKYR